MTQPLELDDLKTAWQALDRKLEQQNTLLLNQARTEKAKSLKRRLWPLRLGQSVQMLVGVLLILLSVSVWSQLDADSPAFWAAIILHGYSVLMIIFGGVMHGLLSEIDCSQPVLQIQKRLARARRFYVVGGMWIGLVWWLLWLPFMMVLVAFVAGVDMYSRISAAVPWIVAGGLLGLVATLAFHRWAQRRPKLAAWLERASAGGSLNRAQAMLDEIAAFERN